MWHDHSHLQVWACGYLPGLIFLQTLYLKSVVTGNLTSLCFASQAFANQFPAPGTGVQPGSGPPTHREHISVWINAPQEQRFSTQILPFIFNKQFVNNSIYGSAMFEEGKHTRPMTLTFVKRQFVCFQRYL